MNELCLVILRKMKLYNLVLVYILSCLFLLNSGCAIKDEDTDLGLSVEFDWKTLDQDESSSIIDRAFGVIEGVDIIEGLKGEKSGFYLGRYEHWKISFKLPSDLAPTDWIIYLEQSYYEKWQLEDKPENHFEKIDDLSIKYSKYGESIDLQYNTEAGVFVYEYVYED